MQRVWSTYLPGDTQRSSSPATGPDMDMMFADKSPHSRRASSVASATNSMYSHAPSTTPILHNTGSRPLQPPSAPYLTTGGGGAGNLASPRNDTPLLSRSSSPISLSQHYLPSKLPTNIRKRKGANIAIGPKRGGGTAAFRSGESRVAGQNDEDYDGVGSGSRSSSKVRWNKFKWCLLAANTVLSLYSMIGLIFCLLAWFNIFNQADIIRVGNRQELIMSTIAASLGILTSLVGWSGLLLNNRGFLAWYTFMLWICFIFLLVPGYMSYKRRAFNIEGKVNKEWSQDLGSYGRLRIQNQLGCCGYFSPFVEATVTQTCYARSNLPGCKKPYIDYQKLVLKRWYIVAFSLVPLHVAIMIAGLLCSNHVTYRFGKGMMPPAYRLSMDSMAIIMDNYANQLAEQYGSDVASEVLARSRSNLHLEHLPYNSPNPPTSYSKYDQLNVRDGGGH